MSENFPPFHIRIDDYPSGILPPEPDRFEFFEKILEPMETLEVPYLLAVVPSIIDDDDVRFLKGLKFATFAQHGVDHGRDLGLQKKGPTTIGGPRNEFHGMSEDECVDRLAPWRNTLASKLDQEIIDFVPPFNATTAQLLRALEWLEFKRLYVGAKPPKPTSLAWYGHEKALGKPSDQIDFTQWTPHKMVVTHMTWEMHLLRTAPAWRWRKIVEELADKVTR